jgi:hypothetical protein
MIRAVSALQNIDDDTEIEEIGAYLLMGFLRLREESTIAVSRIRKLSIQQHDKVLREFLAVQSGGLIPVLVVRALLETIKSCFGLDWRIESQGINVADAASGAGGDITVFRADRAIVALEVTERPIDRRRVESTFNSKISPNGLSDYLFVHGTNAPHTGAYDFANQLFGQGHDVNFVEIQPWVLQNLVTLGSECRSTFTDSLVSLLDSTNVPAKVKVAWNDVIRRLVN